MASIRVPAAIPIGAAAAGFSRALSALAEGYRRVDERHVSGAQDAHRRLRREDERVIRRPERTCPAITLVRPPAQAAAPDQPRRVGLVGKADERAVRQVADPRREGRLPPVVGNPTAMERAVHLPGLRWLGKSVRLLPRAGEAHVI